MKITKHGMNGDRMVGDGVYGRRALPFGSQRESVDVCECVCVSE